MSLARTIDEAWEARDTLGVDTKGIVRDAVETVLAELDAGKLRVAEKLNGEWLVHQWLKKAVLLSFRLNGMKLIAGAPGDASWWDKVNSKFAGWGEKGIPSRRLSRRSGLRRTQVRLHRQGRRPDAELRQCRRLCRREHDGRHLGNGRLLRPDRRALPHLRRRGHWRRVWSRSRPRPPSSRTIASSAHAPKWPKGVIVGEGRSWRWARSSRRRPRSSTVTAARSSPARVPPYSVVVPGSLGGGPGKPSLYCGVIIKRVDERTRVQDLDQRVAARLSITSETGPFREPRLSGDSVRRTKGASMRYRALSFQLFWTHQPRQAMGHTAGRVGARHHCWHHLLRNNRLLTIADVVQGKTMLRAVSESPAGPDFRDGLRRALSAVAFYVGCANPTKRLHDRNKSAWWLLVFIALPLVLQIPLSPICRRCSNICPM